MIDAGVTYIRGVEYVDYADVVARTQRGKYGSHVPVDTPADGVADHLDTEPLVPELVDRSYPEAVGDDLSAYFPPR